MYKKALVLLLTMVMVLVLFPVSALVFPVSTFAAPGDVHQGTSWPNGKAKLLGGAPEWVFFKQGNPPNNGIAAVWTPEELDSTAKETYFAKVKEADPSIGNITSSAMISFFYGSQIITNSNNNTGKYQVGAIDGVWYVYVSGGLSHFYYSEGQPPVDPRGKVEVTADVIESFRNIVLQDQYKQDVQDFYKYDVQDFYKYDVQDFYKYDVQDFYKYDVQDFYKYDVQDFYKYDVQDFYKYDVQDFYKYDVQDFYKYDVQDFYKYDVQDFYNRDIQKFYIPVFEKKAIKAGNDTLVTWRNNKTVPGGTFGNGMTYLEINTEKARNEGYTFGIADSSPSNKYVGYNYNVRIEGNDLVISFDNRFISASVSAKVYSTAPEKHDPSGHKTLRTGDELRIPLPAQNVNSKATAVSATATATQNGNNVTITVKDASKTFTKVVEFAKNATKTYVFDGYTVELVYNGNGVKSAKVVSQPTSAPSNEPTKVDNYYLFFHVENGVNFYETADYNFVNWRLAETKYGEYRLIDTVTGAPYLDKTVTGDSYFDKTVTGDPYFDKTVTGDSYFDKTVTGDPYLDKTVTGDPYFDKTVTGDSYFDKTVTGAPYFDKTVTGDPYFDKTVTGDPYLDKTVTGDLYLVAKDVEISNEVGTRSYTGPLSLTVDGVEKPLDQAFDLEPGTHEFTLSFAGRTVTENWAVVAGAENKFAFATQYIDGPNEISKAADLVEKNKLADVTTENKLADVTTENKLADVTTENKLADVTSENKLADMTTENKLADVTTKNKLADVTSENKLTDVKTDKWLPDVYRGSEDPEDPDSIQYGIYTPARP